MSKRISYVALNASHAIAKVKELIERVRFRLIYLPPYLLDLNLIEHIWADLRRAIRNDTNRENNRIYEYDSEKLDKNKRSFHNDTAVFKTLYLATPNTFNRWTRPIQDLVMEYQHMLIKFGKI